MEDQKALKKRLKALMNLPENQVCADCPERQPRWASLIVAPPGAPSGSQPMGAFVCLECSGSHRRLGVHITFVRSINLDSWKTKEVLAMENGGNSKINAIFEPNLPSTNIKPHNHADGPTREKFIRDKYERRKYYDPVGFSVLPTLGQSQKVPFTKSDQNSNQSDGSRGPHRRTEFVGPPSDAARQRLEERRQKTKQSIPNADCRLELSETKDQGGKLQTAKTQSYASPPTFDFLDFGTETFVDPEKNQTDFYAQGNSTSIDLFNDPFVNTIANSKSSVQTSVEPNIAQVNYSGLDMFDFLTKDLNTSVQNSASTQQKPDFGADIMSMYNSNAAKPPSSCVSPNVSILNTNTFQLHASMANMTVTNKTSRSQGNVGFVQDGANRLNSQTLMMTQQQQQIHHMNQMGYQQHYQFHNNVSSNALMRQVGANINNNTMTTSGMNNANMIMQGGDVVFNNVGMKTPGMMLCNGNIQVQQPQSSSVMPSYVNNGFATIPIGGTTTAANLYMGQSATPGNIHTNSVIDGSHAFHGTKSKSTTSQEKQDPFAQFGVNVFRS